LPGAIPVVERSQGCVFADTENPGPNHVIDEARNIPGVVRADALFGVLNMQKFVYSSQDLTVSPFIHCVGQLPVPAVNWIVGFSRADVDSNTE